MPEQCGDGLNRDAILQELGSEGVTEQVWIGEWFLNLLKLTFVTSTLLRSGVDPLLEGGDLFELRRACRVGKTR
jgi:hypothetical protein